MIEDKLQTTVTVPSRIFNLKYVLFLFLFQKYEGA